MAIRIYVRMYYIAAVSTDDNLSISKTFEIPPKLGTSNSLKSQSESKSFGAEALVVEAENEQPDTCIMGM